MSTPHWPKRDRRPRDGHLSPLDGGHDPGRRMCGCPALSVPVGFDDQRPADGHADRRPEPRRARRAAARPRLRRGDGLGPREASESGPSNSKGRRHRALKPPVDRAPSPRFASHAFALENGRLPRKSARRLSGEGCPHSSTRCLSRSTRTPRLRAAAPQSRNATAGRCAEHRRDRLVGERRPAEPQMRAGCARLDGQRGVEEEHALPRPRRQVAASSAAGSRRSLRHLGEDRL